MRQQISAIFGRIGPAEEISLEEITPVTTPATILGATTPETIPGTTQGITPATAPAM